MAVLTPLLVTMIQKQRLMMVHVLRMLTNAVFVVDREFQKETVIVTETVLLTARVTVTEMLKTSVVNVVVRGVFLWEIVTAMETY